MGAFQSPSLHWCRNTQASCHPLIYMTLLYQLLYIILVEGHTHNDHSSKIKFTLLQSGSGSLEDFLINELVCLCLGPSCSSKALHCVMQEL